MHNSMYSFLLYRNWFFPQVPGLSCYRVVSWMHLTGSTLLRCCSTISRMPAGHGLVSCVVVASSTLANTSVILRQVYTHTHKHTASTMMNIIGLAITIVSHFSFYSVPISYKVLQKKVSVIASEGASYHDRCFIRV